MTTKQKANELVNSFYELNAKTDTCFSVSCSSENIAECDKTGHGCGLWFTHAKQCALIMVNERLEELNFTHIGYGKGIMQGYQKTKSKYWNDVKKEIEKL